MTRLWPIAAATVVAACSPTPRAASNPDPAASVVFVAPVPQAPLPVASDPEPWVQPPPSVIETAEGLRIEEVRIGYGDAVSPNASLVVHYEGRLEDGTVFDSSRSRAVPFTFKSNQVIRGFAMGMEGMRVGGIRRVTIPPALGYGDRKNSKIPGGSTLIFEIELLEVQ